MARAGAGSRERLDAGRSERVVVLNPTGYPPRIAPLRLAPRRGSLAGQRVYLVDCRFDDGDILMQQMQNWFAEQMPEVETVLRRKSGVYTERDPELYAEIRARGGAAVVAVGH
jgi:hypothetical protein